MATRKQLEATAPTTKVLDRLQAGTYGDFAEVLEWTYYDTATISATEQTYNLFTQKVGSVISGTQKTLADTNMTSSGSIPQGQNLECHVLKVMYSTGDIKGTAFLNDFYKFLKNTTLEVRIPGKDSMGTWTLMELMGTATQLAMTPTTAGDNISQVQPRYTGLYPLNIPLVLAALTPIEIKIQTHIAMPATLVDDQIMVGLSGMLARSA